MRYMPGVLFHEIRDALVGLRSSRTTTIDVHLKHPTSLDDTAVAVTLFSMSMLN